MEIWAWTANNWFNVLSAVGIVGSLLFTAVSLHSETKTRRIANLLTMTQNHRELWSDFYQNPELKRVLNPAANLAAEPVTRAEETYVLLVIQHLNSVFQAMQSDLTIRPERIRNDVRALFSLPIPQAVWQKMKIFQNEDFIKFVDDCLSGN